MPSNDTSAVPSSDRGRLRQRLLAEREAFVASAAGAAAEESLRSHLSALLDQLSPDCLGLYWPMRSEFNAARLAQEAESLESVTWALPFAERAPARMHYRGWDGETPTVTDGCGILSSDGGPVQPDVVLVPCVGFTTSGYRLGYGGGFFDRYLAAHPEVTAVGVAWSVGALSEAELSAQPHDLPLTLIVTEQGVVS